MTTAIQIGQDRPELQKAIEAFVAAGFAGLHMRVQDDQGVWVGSAGVRKLGDVARPPTASRFWAGSVAKPFTATVVLQLVAEGRIGLDAPVAAHLPDLRLDERITARMLLQHTSGLFNYTGEYFPDGTVVPGIPATGKEWVDTRLDTYRPQDLVGLALARPPRFEPGTDWGYSNTNYTLATLLVERVTGESYADQVQQRILGPLELRDTVLAGDTTDLPEPHAHGYYRYQDDDGWQVADVSRQSLSMLPGAGAAISTTKDLQTFFAALNAGRLLPAALLAEMRSPVGPIDYGLGVFVQDLGAECGTVYHHNGGAPGGYGALMYSNADGTRTMAAGLTTGDGPADPAEVLPPALDALIRVIFCG